MTSYKSMSDKPSVRSPWFWVPSLYFAQGIPYVAVMIVSVLMYKRLGVSNTDIALYTSWLNLPWVIKPFWSPFVDLLKTKRWWVVTMQLLIGAGLAGVAFTIPTTFFSRLHWLYSGCWLLVPPHMILRRTAFTCWLSIRMNRLSSSVSGVLFTGLRLLPDRVCWSCLPDFWKQYGEYPACLVCYILYFRRAVFGFVPVSPVYTSFAERG